MNHSETTWDGYSYPYGDGLLVRVQFDVDAAKEESHLGYGASIRVILFLNPNEIAESGLPRDASTLQSLLDTQSPCLKALLAAGVNFRFVGSMLYGRMFDLAFQVESENVQHFHAAVAAFESPVRIETR